MYVWWFRAGFRGQRKGRVTEGFLLVMMRAVNDRSAMEWIVSITVLTKS